MDQHTTPRPPGRPTHVDHNAERQMSLYTWQTNYAECDRNCIQLTSCMGISLKQTPVLFHPFPFHTIKGIMGIKLPQRNDFCNRQSACRNEILPLHITGLEKCHLHSPRGLCEVRKHGPSLGIQCRVQHATRRSASRYRLQGRLERMHETLRQWIFFACVLLCCGEATSCFVGYEDRVGDDVSEERVLN